MEKCKLERLTFEELAEVMPIVTKKEQEESCGGGNGSSSNPYSWGEYINLLDNDNWSGGYVSGQGWVTGVATTTAFPSAANTMKSYVGLNESTGWATIQTFLNTTGNYNAPQGMPWCAAMFNFAYGPHGIGSAAVNDWRNAGTATTNPQVGTAAIWKISSGYSHMGMVTGVFGDSIEVTHGNWGDAVVTQTFHKSYFDYRNYW